MNVLCRSFFLHDPQLAKFVRAVALGRDTIHIRFPYSLPTQERTAAKILFKSLKDKLTHQHLKQLASSSLAKKHNVTFLTLLMEKGATDLLLQYPRLIHKLELFDVQVLLACAADVSTPPTARDLLGFVRALISYVKRKQRPYMIADLLINHSQHYGPNLTLWALNSFAVSERVLLTSLDLHQNDKHVCPDLLKMFVNPTAHTVLKRETLLQHLNRHPEYALVDTFKL